MTIDPSDQRNHLEGVLRERRLLKRLIAERAIIAIIGGGVSFNVSGSELSTWRGLLKHGIRRVVDVAIPKPKLGWKDKVEWLVENGDTQDLLAIASQLERRLVGEHFRKWPSETVGSLPSHNPRLIHAISRLGIPVATTNYNTLITQITNRQYVTWRDQPNVDYWLNGQDGQILHLHGVCSRVDTVVLGLGSYEILSRNGRAQFVQKVIGMKTFLIHWLRARH